MDMKLWAEAGTHMFAWMMMSACLGEQTPGTETGQNTIPWQTGTGEGPPRPPPPVDTGTTEPLEVVACPSDLSGDYELETTTACVSGRQALLVEAYLGIPYAEPPVGARRWARTRAIAPRQVDEKKGWAVPLLGLEVGPPCLQTYGTHDGDIGDRDGSEDCLTLNVLRPRETEVGDDLPILVFLHGGGFTDGAGSQRLLIGETFANPLDEQPVPPSVAKLAKEAIVVTVNYRLGPLGFLAHPGLAAADPDGVTGNQGLWDALEALRWVHTNATQLGGSPETLTLVGESAGATAACALIASPEASGLFSSAILQGGGCTDIDHGLDTAGSLRAAAFDQGDALADALGCSDAGSAADVLDCLRSKSPEQVMATLPGRRTPLRDGQIYGPVVDGRLLPDTPSAQFAKGDFHKVPVVGGANAQAGALFAARDAVADEGELHAALGVLAQDLGVDPAGVEALYDLHEFVGDPQAALVAALTDTSFVCPTRAALDAMSSHVDTRAFVFEHPADPTFGAPQFSELTYLFGTQRFEGEALELAEAMQAGWISVSNGAPNIGDVGPWPTMGPVSQGGGNWVSIDTEFLVTQGVRRTACDWWAAQGAITP